MDGKQSTVSDAVTRDQSAGHRPPFSATLHASREDVEAANLGDQWRRLVLARTSPRALFASPEWWAPVGATDREHPLGLLAVRDAEGELSGVVPVRGQEVKLDYSVKTRSLWTTRLLGMEVLGGEPMLPPDAKLYDSFFAMLNATYPQYDCISLEMVPTDGFCWRYLQGSPLIKERFLLYTPEGAGDTRLARLPDSFEAYLAKFKSKNRFNLKKKVRLLREHGGGALRLDRYESPEEVEAFLEAGSAVALRSWQHVAVGERIANDPYWRSKLADLARRGLFRGYVLVCGQTPCAFVLGYQYSGVYHYVQPGYDRSFAELAPGIVMLYLMIEDLIVHRPARLLSFGYGDSDYKQMFGNASSPDASVLLLRKTLGNRLRRASHATFRRAVQKLKSRLRAGHP